MTPLTLSEIRDTIIDATDDMRAALLRDLDWMIAKGLVIAQPLDLDDSKAALECQTECNSGCHPDDCDHHGHLPSCLSIVEHP